jgi:hypothetical protein
MVPNGAGNGGSTISPYTSAGTWTPSDASGASLTFTGVSASYTQIGNMVFAYGTLTYPSTANTSAAAVSGLPVTVANASYARVCNLTLSTSTGVNEILPTLNTTTFGFVLNGNAVTNSAMSLVGVRFICIYPAS